jgi:hypothetical protein
MAISLDVTQVAADVTKLLYGKYFLIEEWFKTIPFQVGKVGQHEFYLYDYSGGLTACCADGDTAGTITPKTTPVLCWEQKMTLCKEQLNAFDGSVKMAAGDTGMGTAGATILDQMVNSFKEQITTIAFNGNTSPAFEGYIEQATAVAVTATDIYDAIVQSVMAMPVNSMGDVKIFMSRKNFTQYQLSLMKQNLFHFNPGNTDLVSQGKAVIGFDNISIVPVNTGFPENVMLVTPIMNMLHIGSGVDDESKVDFLQIDTNKYKLGISANLGVSFLRDEYAVASTFTIGAAS